MGEIKTEPIELREGCVYMAKAGDCVFTDNHSIADIVRYAISCCSIEEVQYLLDEEKEESS